MTTHATIASLYNQLDGATKLFLLLGPGLIYLGLLMTIYGLANVSLFVLTRIK